MFSFSFIQSLADKLLVCSVFKSGSLLMQDSYLTASHGHLEGLQELQVNCPSCPESAALVRMLAT